MRVNPLIRDNESISRILFFPQLVLTKYKENTDVQYLIPGQKQKVWFVFFFEVNVQSKRKKKTGLARSLNLSELFPPSSKAEVNSRVFWRNISREAHPNMFAGVNGLEKLFAENAEGCLRSNGEKNAKPQPHNKLEFDTVFVFSTFTRRLF